MNREGQRGFTVVELLIAILLLIVGIMALAETFVAAGKLTLVSERQAAMSHVGRSELERLQGFGYAQLAMTSPPVSSASPANPDYYVSNQGSTYYLQPDPNATAKEQLAIDTASGNVPPAAQPWSSGTSSGYFYDFVTYHTDGNCGSGCPAGQNYKRLVVEVTQSGPGSPKNAVIIQTLVASPSAAPSGYVANGVQNPLQAAGTQCGTPPGPCQIGIAQGNANSYYLYDQTATGSYGGPPSLDNTLHDTVGIVQGLLCNALLQLGCPVPDLMGTTSPSSASSAVLNYSTDLGGPAGSTSGSGSQYQGGRLLTKPASSTCSSPPSANSAATNQQAQTWVTPGVGATETLNGNGGMTLFMQSANGVTASVTLCMALWVYPPSLLNLISLPPVEIGAFAYAVASLPTTPIPVSFTFNVGSATTLTVGKRIGVEVWLAAASSASAAIQYDNPSFASQLQINTS